MLFSDEEKTISLPWDTSRQNRSSQTVTRVITRAHNIGEGHLSSCIWWKRGGIPHSLPFKMIGFPWEIFMQLIKLKRTVEIPTSNSFPNFIAAWSIWLTLCVHHLEQCLVRWWMDVTKWFHDNVESLTAKWWLVRSRTQVLWLLISVVITKPYPQSWPAISKNR